MSTQADPNKLFQVGINIFIIRDGKLLMGKRKNVVGTGQWATPGGRLEQGEDMQYTAARELDEETGLKAESFTFCNLVNNNRDTGHVLQVGFLTNNVIGEPTNREPDKCEGWEWLDLNNLPDNIFFGQRKQIELFKNKGLFADA